MLSLLKRLRLKDIINIIIIILFIVIQVFFDLKLPDYMSEITRLVETSGTTTKDILVPGGYMLACSLLSLLSAVIVGYHTSVLAASFTKNTRNDIFERVQDYSMEEIKDFSVGSLITRTTNDITNIQMFLAMGLQMLIKAPITATWAIIKILDKSYEWSVITFGAVLVLLINVIVLMILVLPKFKLIQKTVDKLNEITRENLNGIRVIRAFNAENFQQDKFEEANNLITNIQKYVQKLLGIMQPMMFLIMNILTLGIYFIGAYLINNANMADKLNIFSNMVVFSSYAIQVIMSFLVLAIIFIMYPRARISAIRVNEVLKKESNIKSLNNKINDIKGCIEFKNVSFKYGDSDEYVLKDISFKVNKGETIAIIGGTGSGKSTLINLIPRFYDVTEGTVLVDDINVKDYNLNKLYDKLGYVSQKAVIFNDTIKNNILYGTKNNKKISSKNYDMALSISQAKEFVDKLGDDTNISSGGTNISGGQKQRISIARAIAKDPEIFIFDDSFSALDYKTDYNLRKALNKSLSDKTIIIVAQRIGTIKNADKIIVLDNGLMVGIGKHEELLKTCKVYQEIAYSQLSSKELNTNEK